jgi:hypothetical protein
MCAHGAGGLSFIGAPVYQAAKMNDSCYENYATKPEKRLPLPTPKLKLAEI